MKHARSNFFLFVALQVWEVAVFALGFLSGGVALEDRGLIVLTDYGHIYYVAILAVLAFLWNRLLTGFDLYMSRRLVTRGNEYMSSLFAVVIASAFLALLGALLAQPINDPAFLITFMLVTATLLLPGRLFGRMFLHAARVHGRNLRFVAIVGSGPEAMKLAKKIEDDARMGYRVLGMFDHEPGLNALPSTFEKGGSLEDLAQVLMRQPVDEVLISLPFESRYSDVTATLNLCRRTGVSARVMSSLLDQGAEHAEMEQIGSVPCLHFESAPDWGWQAYAKRAFDICGAGMGLIGLAPFLLIVALWIKIDSRGPVFFIQKRVGKNKQIFHLFKFRTMTADAEKRQAGLEAQNEAGGPVFKIKADPRITRAGAILRKYSIDELPQLINVILGDMSLVGPRPLPVRDVERFEHDWHSRRFSVRPGLTCSWVLAGRSELNFDAWVRTDLDYIDNWSFFKDIYICLRTIPAVLRGSGAY